MSTKATKLDQPAFSAEDAKPVEAYVHQQSGMTVHFHLQGFAYTVTGLPAGAAQPEKETIPLTGKHPSFKPVKKATQP